MGKNYVRKNDAFAHSQYIDVVSTDMFKILEEVQHKKHNYVRSKGLNILG